LGYVVWMLMLFGPGTDEAPNRQSAIEDIPTQSQCELLKERIAPEGMCVAVNKFVSPRRTKMVVPRARIVS